MVTQKAYGMRYTKRCACSGAGMMICAAQATDVVLLGGGSEVYLSSFEHWAASATAPALEACSGAVALSGFSLASKPHCGVGYPARAFGLFWPDGKPCIALWPPKFVFEFRNWPRRALATALNGLGIFNGIPYAKNLREKIQ